MQNYLVLCKNLQNACSFTILTNCPIYGFTEKYHDALNFTRGEMLGLVFLQKCEIIYSLFVTELLNFTAFNFFMQKLMRKPKVNMKKKAIECPNHFGMVLYRNIVHTLCFNQRITGILPCCTRILPIQTQTRHRTLFCLKVYSLSTIILV